MAFDSQSGDSFQLNETARTIITLLQQGLAAEEVARGLTGTYSITYEEALTDVLEFQVQLHILGLMK
jgi:hypothetical protein